MIRHAILSEGASLSKIQKWKAEIEQEAQAHVALR